MTGAGPGPDEPSRVTRSLDRLPAPALTIGGVASTQLGAALATGLFPAVGIAGVVALRLTLAAAVLGVGWRRRLRRTLPGWGRRTWALAALTGMFLVAHHLSYYEAISRLPLGSATTIEFAGPLTVALVTARRWSHVGWALLAAGGVVGAAGPGGHMNWPGILCAVSAGACWACYITVSASLTRRVGDSSPLAPAMACGALIGLPLGAVTAGTALLRPESLLRGLAVGLLSGVLAYTLQMDALRRMPRRLFGILVSTEPAVSALVGLVILGQRLTMPEAGGILAVVAASAGSVLTA